MVSINKSATSAFYYSYPPYLQPTSSLGTSGRVAGSISLGTRPKIGGITRIYNFFKTYNQEQEFRNNLVFSVYGKKV